MKKIILIASLACSFASCSYLKTHGVELTNVHNSKMTQEYSVDGPVKLGDIVVPFGYHDDWKVTHIYK